MTRTKQHKVGGFDAYLNGEKKTFLSNTKWAMWEYPWLDKGITF